MVSIPQAAPPSASQHTNESQNKVPGAGSAINFHEFIGMAFNSDICMSHQMDSGCAETAAETNYGAIKLSNHVRNRSKQLVRVRVGICLPVLIRIKFLHLEFASKLNRGMRLSLNR